MRSRLAALTVSLLAVLCVGSPAANLAFSYVGPGEPLPPLALTDHAGGQGDYLGGEGYRARLFAFVKGDQGRSAEVLAELAGLLEEFRDRPVHWALVVSGRHGRAWADSVAAAVPAATVLIDERDELYGMLGVALSPVVGLATAERTLHAYLPYQKIHYRAVIRAHLQFLLGDIDADRLAAVLRPGRERVHDSAEAGCRRALKLAEMLIKGGKADKALVQVENVLAECPQMAEAYAALAEVRRLQGDEEGALNAVRRARELEGN